MGSSTSQVEFSFLCFFSYVPKPNVPSTHTYVYFRLTHNNHIEAFRMLLNYYRDTQRVAE